MLPPNYLEDLENQVVKIYNNLELEIIEEIAERISNVGYANTVVKNDVMIAQEMGLLYQDIINMVSEHSNESYEKIQDIFNKAGIKTLQFDDSIYKEAGLNPIPIRQSKSMLDLLLATAKKTSGNLQNLAMTTANTSQDEFINAINTAYMEVSTGAKSYSQSIIDTISKVSEKGSIVQYPSGYRTSMENATRMNIITGVNQTCGKLQQMRAEELGWDLMELTAHAGARPTHAEWQGKIVSLSGKSGYLSLDDIGYGTATGFKGVNCYHDWRPYYEGSSRTYTQKELERMSNETVTYNGQKIKRYEAQQMQRKMERQIRQDKKDIAGIKSLLTSNNKEIDADSVKSKLQQLQNKYNTHNSKLNDFLEQTKFRKDNSRLFVGKIMTNVNSGSIIQEEPKKTIKSAKTFNLNNKVTINNLLDKLKIDINNYKPFGKYDPYENNIQEQTAELLNFNELPKVLNSKEFDNIQSEEIIRVVHSYHGKTAEQAYENTIRGKIQYSECTNSSYGRGIYFGSKKIQDNIITDYSRQDNKIINAKINSKAKILEFENQIEYTKDLMDRFSKVPEDLREFYKNEKSLLYMLDGVDGIKLKWNNYYCIYNRGVLIINE